MTERSKIVRCIITQAGLETLARHELTIDQFERAFHSHRDRIESTASSKYDASRALYTPFTITPADLVAFRAPSQIGRPDKPAKTIRAQNSATAVTTTTAQ